jgi:TDG/mug DNA glycosylase family protein
MDGGSVTAGEMVAQPRFFVILRIVKTPIPSCPAPRHTAGCGSHVKITPMPDRVRPILPDVLAPRLRLVFCGTAPGARSALEGAYYAHPGNYFWRTLFEVGLTPVRLSPPEYRRVLEFGIGLTDVAKHHFGSDAELPRGAFDAEALRRKIARFRPRIVAFTSKNAARAGLACGSRKLACGEQDVQIAGSRVFVLSSPSGQARGFWNIEPWQALARAVAKLGDDPG